jgi:hypothetical protein
MQMSKYNGLKSLSDEKFRRLTGVKHKTFEKMTEILKDAHSEKKKKGGRPNNLCVEDMLLMALEYLREYRTYFHIGQSYGLSESNAYQTVKWVENTLVKDGAFSLPGKKALLKSDVDYEVVLIDVAETPVERPKKTAEVVFREEKAAYDEGSGGCRQANAAHHMHVFFEWKAT